MNDPVWDALLIAGKIVFLALVYLLLLLVIVAVRREMRHHLEREPSSARSRRLKILQAGSDAQLRPGQVWELPDLLTIGSGHENQVIFRDRFVSGRHAQLRWAGSEWLITDLNSTNGTFINEQRCRPHTEQPVPGGAILHVGDVTFQLE